MANAIRAAVGESEGATAAKEGAKKVAGNAAKTEAASSDVEKYVAERNARSTRGNDMAHAMDEHDAASLADVRERAAAQRLRDPTDVNNPTRFATKGAAAKEAPAAVLVAEEAPAAEAAARSAAPEATAAEEAADTSKKSGLGKKIAIGTASTVAGGMALHALTGGGSAGYDDQRTDTGMHIVTVEDENSPAFKAASSYGSPIQTQDGKWRFTLSEGEFARFQKQIGG